ncbi:hypothetical protein M9Y10_009847 [Tritrichomonas musculus]|uniref:Uncharacterized protein n=1 Tax=Tritrichomonas musculus TaxID=1915356 RepID=A0ABR2IPJ4_9EUKA
MLHEKIIMNLSYYSSYGDSQDFPIPEPSGSFNSMCFSTCGQILAAGTEKGRVLVFPTLNQNQISSKACLCPSHSFNVPQSRFDCNRGIFTSEAISSVQFSPEFQLNPKLLVNSSYSTHLYQIVHDDTFKWVMPNNPKNGNLQNFECPQKQSSLSQCKSDLLLSFDDIRLNERVDSDFYCPSAFFVTASNAACIFDMNKKNGSNEATLLSFIPDDDFNSNICNNDSNLSTMNSDINNKSNHRIVCSDLNKQFQELFLLGMSDGKISLYDMRQQPENLTPSFTINSQQFVQKEHRDNFPDVKSLKFAPNNLLFAARTFGDIMIFDIRKPNETFAHLDVQWFKKMDSVILTGMGSDKFGLEFIGITRLVSGAYDEAMVVWDFENQSTSKVELASPNKKKTYNHFINQVNCIKADPIHRLMAATSCESIYFYTFDNDSDYFIVAQEQPNGEPRNTK